MAAVSWKNPVSGNWTLNADWSTGAVPGAADDVTIGVLGSYSVAITAAVAIHSLTLSDLNATLTIKDPGAAEKITANFTNAGAVALDASGSGGTTLNIGGKLTNYGLFTIGNAGLAAATTVTAASLANTGEIDLTGGTAQATLDVTGATPATLTGQFVLQGNALLEVPSTSVTPSGGSITAIAGHAELVLDGAQARVAVSTSTAGNTGLTGLASNAGTLAIQQGSKISTGGGFTNNGLVEVDNDIFGTGDAGGSSLAVKGLLTNRGDLDIGNSGLTTAATVTAAALANTAIGTVNLTGSDTVQASLTVGGAAPATLTGFYFLDGDALLQFGSGHVTSVAANSELSLDGARARVALAADPASNSALTLLAANNGTLDLEDHAAVAIATGLVNRNELEVDTLGGGGSRLTIAGVLTNAGDLAIGGGSLVLGGAPALVSAAGLADSGTIALTGGPGRATLDILGAALPTVTGSISLTGNALLEFGSGSVATIADGGFLELDGTRARVALNSDPTTSGALAKLASNAGRFILADGATVATTVGFNNTGTLDLDAFELGALDSGGSSLSIGGVLTNNSSLGIGNSRILAATTVTAAGLVNTGSVDLTGGAATQATFNVTGAAPATLTGSYDLSGDALLEFKSGGVAAIGAGSSLFLGGASSRVALAAAPGSNSALTGLAGNAGTLALQSGAVLATKVVFNNAGTVEIDNGFDNGGSSLALGGTLTNSSALDIGNVGLSKTTTVTAPGLVNTGTVELAGGSATPATLHVTGPAPATLTGSYSLSGDAILEYNSGGIAAIGTGAGLTLNGALSRVALLATPAIDSALLGLASNAGSLTLENGAALPITTNFVNNGAVEIDSSGGGGSRLAVGGALTNTSSLTIGNTAMTKAATVTAGSLDNSGSLVMTSGPAAAVLTVSKNFTNTGSVQIDLGGFSGGDGGSSVTVHGTLTNGSSSFEGFAIGNATLAKATTVTAAGLANSGTIDLTGGTAAATLHVMGAAPATLTGTFDLSGNALLEYDSGGITAIGATGNLSLSGAQALVALKSAPTMDSALTGLVSNAGTLALENGAALTISGDFNSFTLDVDNSGSGGSSLAVGGALTSNFLTIGNNGITHAATVTAKSLANSGTLALASGSAAAAKLTLSNGLTNTGVVEVDTSGFGAGGSGGSTVKIGGALTNIASGFEGVFSVGNITLSRATTVTAGSVTNSGTLDLTSGTAAPKLIVGSGFTNTGFAEIDTSDAGGSVLAIGGTLTNSASGFDQGVAIGNASLSKATLVTAKALANTGTIDITGAAAIAATLHITGAAPMNLAGTYVLTGDALLEFDSGKVTALASGASLTLNGTKALVASGLPTISALGGLASNAGTLVLENGAVLTTTGGFANSGTLDIDPDSSGEGGARLEITGALVNNASATITIEGPGHAKATTMTAASVANAGSLNLTSGTAAVTVTVGGGFTNSSGVALDDGFDEPGGSTLEIGGALTNSGIAFTIGNGGMTAATKVSAASLTNNTDSNISISGGSGTSTGTLSLGGASTDAGNITVNTGGVLALGNTLTVSGSLELDGGTVFGGTLATSGGGTLQAGVDQSAALIGVTIGSGSTFTSPFGSTLTLSGVTVSGSLVGSGTATLDFAMPTTAASLTNVSGFAAIGLASGAANTLTLADANFAGLFGRGITIDDSNSGNTVNGAALSASNFITVNAGSGADVLTGGAGNDVFFAGGTTTMTGGGGTNQFAFHAAGPSNTIKDFAASGANELVFSNAGFNLGQSGATSTPQALPTSLFTTGSFTNTTQRLAYNAGQLFASADGSGSTPHLVATLTGSPSITAASQLFFIS